MEHMTSNMIFKLNIANDVYVAHIVLNLFKGLIQGHK